MNPNAAGTNALQNTGGGLGLTGSSPTSNNNASALTPGIAGATQLSPASGTIAFNANPSNNAIASSQAQINTDNSQLSSISALLKSIQAEEAANVPGQVLTSQQLNLPQLQSAASSAAANQVNPLYTQYLNEYNQSLAANQAAAQSENANNIQAEQNTLQNTLSSNQQAQLYAGQQNAATQGNINAQAQNYQLNSGDTENAKIQSIASTIGSGNLGASGYGQQQLWNAENTRNIADAQQQGQFQYQRNSSNLSTQDTFAQLAQSSLYAQQGATTSETATNFNLNDYLRQAAANDTAYTQALTANQQLAISATEQNNLAQSLQAAINNRGLSGKDLAATEQAYSYDLTSESQPGMINPTDYTSGPNAATV